MAFGFQGPNIDLVTREPVERRREEEKLQKEMEASRRRLDLLEDLNSSGRTVLELIEHLLKERLEALMRKDEECNAYLNILSRLERDIKAPEKIAEKEIARIRY